MSKNILSKIKQRALKTLTIEAAAIKYLIGGIDDDFCKCVSAIFSLKGRVIVSGIGKSGIIAQKIVATLNSTGTPAIFMHGADALHGDLGMVQVNDFVLLLSKSGETEELKLLAYLLRDRQCPIATITGSPKSSIGNLADFTLNSSVELEACPNNLAPTASTIAQLALGDAIAMCLQELRTFSPDDFARVHPAGILGKRLSLKVGDLMEPIHKRPFVDLDADIQKVIIEISSKRLGATAVLGKEGNLLGIITDGDLRRAMQQAQQFQTLKAREMMNQQPITINSDTLATEALKIMNQKKITQLLVLEQGNYIGMVHIHQVLKEGIA